MTEYFEAIPTVFRGQQYRSRSEAMFSALLDRFGHVFSYEATFFPSWSPDFLVEPQIAVDFRWGEHLADFPPLEIFEKTFQWPLDIDEIWLALAGPVPSKSDPYTACWGWKLCPGGVISELKFTVNGSPMTLMDALRFWKSMWFEVVEECDELAQAA